MAEEAHSLAVFIDFENLALGIAAALERAQASCEDQPRPST